MDGTFKVAPTLFCQAYVILIEILGGVHPAVYALLPNKKEQTYVKLFSIINQLQPDLHPTSVSCDFELGAITAIKNSFENINIFGCYFHLSQKFLESYIYCQNIIMNQTFVLQPKQLLHCQSPQQ